jgi:hypothetical protein
MRWTLVVPGRRRGQRTAKPRGSDISTLISTGNDASHHAGMVARKPDHQEERGAAVKTSRAGKAGHFRQTCGGLVSRAFIFRTRSCGCAGTPGFPCSLRFSRGDDWAKLGRDASREGWGVSATTLSSFRDAPSGAGPESIVQQNLRENGFRARANARPGMTEEIAASQHD